MPCSLALAFITDMAFAYVLQTTWDNANAMKHQGHSANIARQRRVLYPGEGGGGVRVRIRCLPSSDHPAPVAWTTGSALWPHQ
jgi:hypothetical protein